MKLEITIPARVWVSADGGADAVFIPWIGSIADSAACLKVFRTRTHAMRSRIRQLRAWRHGLAPMTGPLVRVRVEGQRSVRHAYISQQVIAYDFGDHGKQGFPTSQEREALKTKLRAAGFRISDVTWCNVGRLTHDSELVMLDFGDASS